MSFLLKLLLLPLVLIYYPIRNFIRFLIPFKYKAKSISKDIILLTGAGNGLGKLLAKKLAKHGATLVLLDIDEKANEQTKREILAKDGIAYAFKCDVSSHDDVKRVADKVKQDIGDVTILVNNAGILIGKELLKLTDNEIERVFKINVFSNFWTNKEFLPSMIKKNKGHIVTTASTAGWGGVYRLVDYCSSKHAVVGFNEALTNELHRIGATGIKTTLMCPNYTNTGMCDGVTTMTPLLDPEEVTDRMLEAILTEQRILFIPIFLIKFFLLVKSILPIEVSNYIANDLTGVNSSMDTFVGNRETFKDKLN